PRQRDLEATPDPACEIFACRVRKARHLIQEVVVEDLVNWLERALYLGEVRNPTGVRVDLASDVNFAAERVSVEARALVIAWNVRQPMRCFERELLEDLRDVSPHGIPSTLCVWRLSLHFGCFMQYSTARCVLRWRAIPSIGCKKRCS